MSETNVKSTPTRRRRRKAASTDRTVDEVRAALQGAAKQLCGSFVEREDAVNGIMLSLITGMNYLLVGPPGTAKTKLAECAAKHVSDARFFSPAALGPYTMLKDLVGPTSYETGERETEGYLAGCEIAFLDELFKTSDATVNSLLGIFNERKFQKGTIPLWSIGSATNWPEVNMMKPVVSAFWDRLHMRIVVDGVKKKSNMRNVLRQGREFNASEYTPESTVTLTELRRVSQAVRDVKISPAIEDLMINMHDRLAKEQIVVSDRRLVQLQHVLQANAWMNGRDFVTVRDFEILVWCCWQKKDDFQKCRSVIDTIDHAFAQSVITKVNNVRNEFRTCEQTGWTLDSAQQYVMNASTLAGEIADSIESQVFTKQSQADVIDAAKHLQQEVQEVVSKFGENLLG